MNRPTAEVFDRFYGRVRTVELGDAMRAVARYAEEMIDSARYARTSELRDAFLDRAAMLQALTYFALPGAVKAEWLDGERFRGSFEIDEAVLGAYKGGSSELIDVMLRDLRAQLLERIARRSHEPAA